MAYKIISLENPTQKLKDAWDNELIGNTYLTFDNLQEALITFLGSRMHYFLNNYHARKPDKVFGVNTIPSGCFEDSLITGAKLYCLQNIIGEVKLKVVES